MSSIFEELHLELNTLYLFRLHYDTPKQRSGKHGTFYYTTLDAWKGKGGTVDDGKAVKESYESGSPPIPHKWSFSYSFATMWSALNLRRDTVFFIKKRMQLNQRQNKEYPFYEIMILGDKDRQGTYSTLDFRGGTLSDSFEREMDDESAMTLEGKDAPKEYKLLHPNPDAYLLLKHSVIKAHQLMTELKDENQIEISEKELVPFARHFYYETIKKGWTKEW